ncbi:hypothetical protein CSA08_03445 [Candidatus Gracilibacteria bacterium]|nr:MAG: hypothetical protein CSA08_03445 [Candidatus Gracilibacteria bacterium]
MEQSFLFNSASLVFLLIISSITYIFSKKINFPYTILLVLIGLILIPLSKISFLGFINDFSLNPNILFFVFLPLLLFEAGYNINIRELKNNWIMISILSIFGVILSSLLIGFSLFLGLNLVGFNIDFLICLLFGSLISATDPVTVIAIFKGLGAPKRLTLIFEGESLFNDGTAVALFMIVLTMIMNGGEVDSLDVIQGIFSFFTMIFGGIIIGGTGGYLFSKLLGHIKYNEEAEITIALLSSYTVFIVAEYFSHHFSFLPISGIIATVVSSITIGNYGKYKITPKSEDHMNKFLIFFTFVINSLVFILMGLTLDSIEAIFLDFTIPIIIAILVLLLARFLTVYLSIGIVNSFKLEERVPEKWKSILFWGGLKGVLAIMLVMMIPSEGNAGFEKILEFENNIGWTYSYHFKDFLTIITISSIMFSLFVKAPTISYLMRRIGIGKVEVFEKVEEEEWKIIANLKIIEKLVKFYKNNFLDKKEYLKLKNKYKNDTKKSVRKIKEILRNKEDDLEIFIKRIIYKYALGIEKQYLKKLFFYKKIEEKNFLTMLNDIELKIQSINNRLKNKGEEEKEKPCFLRKMLLLNTKFNIYDIYIINRTKYTIGKKVIRDLKSIPNEKSIFDEKLLKYVIGIYEYSCDLANKKRVEIKEKNPIEIGLLEKNILNKTFLKVEEKLLKDLNNKEIIPVKFYNNLIGDLNKELYSNSKPSHLS